MKNIFDALNENLPGPEWEIIIGMPENPDGWFSHSGSDFIDTLACNVYDVHCLLLKRNIFGRVIEQQEFEAQVCHEILDATANGTHYYQNKRGDWIPEWELR